jgi:penicillin-binding protein 2
MLVAFLLLCGSLWKLQVADSSLFEDRQKVQSIRRVRLPGIRGKIYDRNNLCLADNRPVYSIALYPEEIRVIGSFSKTVDRAMEAMSRAAEITGLEPVLKREDIQKHINFYRPLPLILWRDIGPQTISRLSEQGMDVPGIDIHVDATRNYPYSPYTSHLIGYVREDKPEEDEGEKFNYDRFEMSGRAGIEKLFDEFMRGEAGAKLVQVDVGIYRYGELARRAPSAGGDLQLTLDMEIQLLAHQAISTNRGAVVVLDPNNGDVLAMYSSPSYDANLFTPRLLAKDWNRLMNDPDKPLINRAVAGEYSPGSTFKPLVGLAVSTVNPNAPYTVYESPGTFRIGRRVVQTQGHGRVNMREALRHSANVYFFKSALENGWESIVEQALAVGLGQKTGVEVDFERSGLVPDQTWQQKRGHGGWTDGDTCNLAIGQGFLTTTPLQMAMVTATIANGGTVYKPRLLQAYSEPENEQYIQNPPQALRSMSWSADALQVVQGGMLDVVTAEDGTGRKASVPGFPFAAKTGTAEYGPKKLGKKHTWMVAFAPFENPQFAVAFLIEDGASGGRTVGPRMKMLMEGLYAKLQREGRMPLSGTSLIKSEGGPS